MLIIEKKLSTVPLQIFENVIRKLTGASIIQFSRITPYLFVGGQFRRKGKRSLQKIGVTCSINLRYEFDDNQSGLIFNEHCYLPTLDNESPTMAQLLRGIAFIDQAVMNNKKVYIHCKSGIGRAPTMGAAYFISKGYSLYDAIKKIKSTRPFICLSESQIKGLLNLEVIYTRYKRDMELNLINGIEDVIRN